MLYLLPYTVDTCIFKTIKDNKYKVDLYFIFIFL